MARNGPPPTPTHLKLLKGEKKSRINTSEPKPPEGPGAPAAPRYLSSYAKREWGRLGPSLWERGRLLTIWDRATFAAYCEAVAVHKAATEDISEHGLIEVEERKRFSRSGDLLTTDLVRVTNPSVRIQRDAANTVRQYAQEFGLTPSARSVIKTEPPSDAEGAKRLLS